MDSSSQGRFEQDLAGTSGHIDMMLQVFDWAEAVLSVVVPYARAAAAICACARMHHAICGRSKGCGSLRQPPGRILVTRPL